MFCVLLGVLWAPYPHWKKLRSIAISTLKDGGMGKASIESQILEEVETYIDYFIKPNTGRPISVAESIPLAVNNVISHMLYASKFPYDDEQANKLVSSIPESFILFAKLSFLNNIPFSGWIKNSLVMKLRHIGDTIMFPASRKQIDHHIKTLDCDNPRDVVDRFLTHSQTVSSEEQPYFTGLFICFPHRFYAKFYNSSFIFYVILFCADSQNFIPLIFKNYLS